MIARLCLLLWLINSHLGRTMGFDRQWTGVAFWTLFGSSSNSNGFCASRCGVFERCFHPLDGTLANNDLLLAICGCSPSVSVSLDIMCEAFVMSRHLNLGVRESVFDLISMADFVDISLLVWSVVAVITDDDSPAVLVKSLCANVSACSE